MLIFDDLTIIICVALLLLAIASVLTDTFLRKVSEVEATAETDSMKQVSVIIIADNNAHELDKHLPAYLSQDYPAGFEVIVVVCKNEDNTDDVLKMYMSKDAKLRTTFVPDTSRYMSRRKLAITLGVKAAKHNLILLTDAECQPDTDKWILSMATVAADANASMVIGYSNYSAEVKQFRLFNRMHRQYALMCEVMAGRPYATVCRNLMFDKSMFMEGKGFQGNLKYLRGEHQFLVNKYGVDHIVAATAKPDSRLTEDAPSNKAYSDRCVFYAETRKHLSHSLWHRTAFNADMFSLHACLLMSVWAGIYGGITQRWIMLAVAVLSLVLPFITRTVTARRALRFFGSTVPPMYAVAYELRLAWHNFIVFMKYKRADKADFISHKS